MLFIKICNLIKCNLRACIRILLCLQYDCNLYKLYFDPSLDNANNLSSQKYYYYRRPIEDPLETHQRIIGDPSENY